MDQDDVAAYLAPFCALENLPDGEEQPDRYIRVRSGKSRDAAKVTPASVEENIVGKDPRQLAARIIDAVADLGDNLPVWIEPMQRGRSAPLRSKKFLPEGASADSGFSDKLADNPGAWIGALLTTLQANSTTLRQAADNANARADAAIENRDRFALSAWKLLKEERDARLLAEVQVAQLTSKEPDDGMGDALDFVREQLGGDALKEIAPAVLFSAVQLFKGRKGDKETPDEMADRLIGEAVMLGSAHPEVLRDEKRAEKIQSVLETRSSADLVSLAEMLGALRMIALAAATEKKEKEEKAAAEAARDAAEREAADAAGA